MPSTSADASPRQAEGVVGRLVMLLVGLALVLTVLLVMVRPRDANFDYRQVWVAAALVFALAAAFLLTTETHRRCPKGSRTDAAAGREKGRSRVVHWVWAGATSVAGGVAGVLLALPLRYAYGWDAAVVTGFSRQLSSAGTLSAYAQDYLSRYPNNVPLVAMMNVARSLGDGSDRGMYFAYVVANGVCLSIVLFLSFVLVRLLRGSAAAFLSQGVVFVLVGCSPWMAVPYTDFPAMPFVLAGVVLAVVASRRTHFGVRAGLAALAFALVGVAFVIKSTPATTAVAFVVALLIFAIGRPRQSIGRLAVVGFVGLAAFGLSVTGTLAAADRVAHVSRDALDTSRTAPTTWWLANGLTTSGSPSGRPYYGGYSPEMVNSSMHLSGQALQRWSDERLTAQLHKMGPGGIAAFEINKQAFNWGDGMFFVWGEGYDYQAKRLEEHGPVAAAVQSVQHPSGSHYRLRASLTNGLWLAILLWAGVGLLRAPYRRPVLILALAVLGIAVFTLLFQGRSRYLFAYVPVVIALASTVDPLRRRSSYSRLGRLAAPSG